MRQVFKRFLTDTITHRAFETEDPDGVASYGVATSHLARLEHKRRMVYDGRGRELVSDTTLIVDDSLTAMHPRDQIELADGSHPRVLKVERFTDSDGSFSHFEVVLGGGPA